MQAKQQCIPLSCEGCANGKVLDFDFSMAFQPIVDVQQKHIFAYEALARGLDGGPAGDVFKRVDAANLYKFDQTCRVKAVKLAAQLGMQCMLSINFMPNAVYRPEVCISTTLNAAKTYDFPVKNIMFEFTECEQVQSYQHVKNIVDHYQKIGFSTALDDFGAGYSGLNNMAEIATNFVKIDMALLRAIETNPVKQAIVKGIVQICTDLGRGLIAEGVETEAEYSFLRGLGITLFQGYWFAKPQFEALPKVELDGVVLPQAII